MHGQQNVKKWGVLLPVQFLLTICAIGRPVSNKRSETVASVQLLSVQNNIVCSDQYCLFRPILSVQTNILCHKQTFLNEGINYRQLNQRKGKKNISSCVISLLRSFQIQHSVEKLSAFWF